MNKKNKIIIIAIIGLLLASIGVFLLIRNYDSSNSLNENQVANYLVTFDTKGGTIINPQNINYGSMIVEPEIPQKTGYEFQYWEYNNEKYDFNETVKEDITLIAIWKEKNLEQIKYTITFDTNGGNEIESIKVLENTSINSLPIPVKKGYTFKNWICDDKKFDITTLINSDIVLKAEWIKIQNSTNNNDVNNDSNNNSNSSVVPNKQILPQSIYLNLDSIDLYCDSLEQIKATISPSNAIDKSIIWTSSNNNVATVDKNGIIKPVSIGKAIITATTVNGKTASVNVNIKEICKKEDSVIKLDEVTGVYVKYGESNQIDVTYNKVNYTDIYEIYRSSDNIKYDLMGAFTSNVGIFNNLDTTKSYYYKVRACTYSNVCGDFSDEVNVPAKIKAPSNINFSGNYSVKMNTGKMVVSFSLNSDVSYEIYSSDIGVASNEMINQSITNNDNVFNLFWDTKPVQYKIVGKKKGKNYEMYSSSNVYKIPGIDKANGCNIVVTRSEKINGTSTSYSYNYKYSWDLVSNIDGYILKENNNGYKFKEFLSNENSYETSIGQSDVTLLTFKKGTNYSIQTYNECLVSKNFN